MAKDDLRLIEAGFPCHQVGAETRRERDTGKAPPTHRLHVWWARRPLTPSRAAILASLLPADADPEAFIRNLGIVRWQALIGDERWTLISETITKRLVRDDNDPEHWLLPIDDTVLAALDKEHQRRARCRDLIVQLESAGPDYANDPVLQAWQAEVQALPSIAIEPGNALQVIKAVADPAGVKDKIAFAKRDDVQVILGRSLRWDDEDSYGYSRAFETPTKPLPEAQRKVVLDPTAGGGSIPFEALRLGHRVIANELNPVASVILKATLDYPARYGLALLEDIARWGDTLRETVEAKMAPFTPFSPIPSDQRVALERHLQRRPDLVDEYATEHDHMGLLYCRQVTCPHCGGEAPLLNSLWLSKEGEQWAVDVQPQADKTVRFEPYVLGSEGRKPDARTLDAGTVTRGVGQCVHCHQAIAGDEIKRQARGESELGRWQDVLYCVVGIRLEPKLDKHGEVQRFASGARKGEIKTSKVRYFRAPNEIDQQALAAASAELEARRFDFEMKGLVPNESIGEISNYDRGHRMYGENLWIDMFTPRQLLGHLTVMEALSEAKPRILEELGEEKGRAVVTYLQFMLDKGIDYNCSHTRWEYTQGIVKGAFSRHNFALQWTFGEMVFSGPSSGFRWGISQVLDAYQGIAELLANRHQQGLQPGDLIQTLGPSQQLQGIADQSVDAVVMDPPYYDNVQYSELSDFYYVWQKRSLGDLYPGWFDDEVTDKQNEVVANPARDGSAKLAKARYETLMQETFAECRRVLKPEGLMTLMFTHKGADAWETLTNALIEAGWDITACMPVQSEGGYSTHQMNLAAAASTIFIACRPADRSARQPSSWAYEVRGRLETAVREGLTEFARLNLNPVDRMIASWGRALRVYSEHWPVQDGDEDVPPTRAMQEAARVVAEEEVSRLSGGLVTVEDLDSESRLAVIALGINGLGEFAFDDALQISRSLSFHLQQRNGNYRVSDDLVAYASASDGERAAPLAIRGSKLRLLKPEERAEQRLEHPQALWDVLCGLISIYREGGIVAARNYLGTHDKRDSAALRGLLKVWANECDDEALRREALLIDYEL
ncbi:DUF1156 domain-containing protein [Halochromatium salexigens]|uniref:DUF1156 domain-containing protein n=1 Tax=Halochromatium salexigens TaxID=49447 RepID=A0AAJ0XFR2_HALSE|nr:DUF1156 domain-containing protein [Halochromatium salexigens]MBK5930391.1 hypothetical protein [Halochromatium salexigens]